MITTIRTKYGLWVSNIGVKMADQIFWIRGGNLGGHHFVEEDRVR